MRAKNCWTKPASNPIHRLRVLTESADSGSKNATLERQLFSTALSGLAGGDFGGKAFRITSSPLFKTSGSSPEGRKISSLFSVASSSAALNRIIELPHYCSDQQSIDRSLHHLIHPALSRPFRQQPVNDQCRLRTSAHLPSGEDK